MRSCPTCHQPMRYERVGLFLGPSRTLLFDILVRAGEEGVTLEDLAVLLHQAGKPPANINALRTQMSVLGGMLAMKSNLRIVRRLGRPSVWFLYKLTERAA